MILIFEIIYSLINCFFGLHVAPIPIIRLKLGPMVDHELQVLMCSLVITAICMVQVCTDAIPTASNFIYYVTIILYIVGL